MTKESTLTRKILQALRSEGGFWYKTHGSGYQMSGLPDIIGCYMGQFVGLEVKLPETTENLSPRQLAILSSIERAGGIQRVVATTLDALQVIHDIRMMSERKQGS
jgi:Holliday junction resolvase